MTLTELTINQIHQGLKKKDFSALELCRAYLDKIKKDDKNIFAFLTVSENFALAKAKEVDDMIMRGEEISSLAGVPCAIKDNILVKDIRATAGSKVLENYVAPYDATVIKKLKRQNVVILGKTNLDEFAMGSSTENSAFGPTRNPLDLTRVAGGSSGGSAAAVAGELALFALGSDTGGSIRLPATFCGVVGLKPTYGAVSRYGLIAFASSLDQIGPMTRTVEDAKIVFDAIKGRDFLDSTTQALAQRRRVEEKNLFSRSSSSIRARNEASSTSVELSEKRKAKFAEAKALSRASTKVSASEKFDLKEIKIGVPKEYFVEGMDPEVEKAIKGAIKKYEEMGAKIEEISLPYTKYALACYYIIACSEASANLARYDGIKYGYSEAKPESSKAENLLSLYLHSRGGGFGPEVKRRIMMGTYSLSSGYYEAYYSKAQQARTRIAEDFEKAFERVDLIFAPVSPFLPFKIGEKIENPLSMYLVDVYTVSVNLAGLPALSLPCGKVKGLPVGLQIIGKPFEEDKILAAGKLL